MLRTKNHGRRTADGTRRTEIWITKSLPELSSGETKKQVILSALCLPDFVIPRSLSTLYRCSLTTMAQDKPFHKMYTILNRDYCNHNPYLIIAAGISSLSFVRASMRQLAVSSLSKGISRTLNFHENIDTEGTQTPNFLY